ncbi:RNA polymerase sigma factor SigJ [Methylobacterium brachiatum]|uniref:RNA polymerase sigma factor SigJ n=1 Tax=Methylobacterium brachiatum TaxID=269660 RepID=UPI00244A5542|nr:RNA polymerase sigma factor SigJ [Methylobacterium brachiatum]MDH2307982.1 RNA polymerase sigma factor SigJ [Methylobacterium brachiatum]
MTASSGAVPETGFRESRPALIRLAYRMLGSMADAEDVVQDAYARWLAADRGAVREPGAFLRIVVTRLCLNQLKSARRRRETYLGPWLPEPIFDPAEPDELDDITLPLMIALERLSPLERAAFLLHDVFGMAFSDLAEALGREEAACRKLTSRARAHLRETRPRFIVAREDGLRIAAAFFAASRSGDMDALRALLADEVVAMADGGGKVPASLEPLVGQHVVLVRHAVMARDFVQNPSRLLRYAVIDGLPGFVTVEAGGIVQTTALHVRQDKVVAIYVVRNPDKTRRVSAREGPQAT